MTNLIPHVAVLAVLAVIVGGLALYRKAVASKEDDTVHLSGGEAAVEKQVAIATKLEAIDKWGKILTVVLVIYGLVIAGLYILQMWEESSKTPQFG
ncbi:MAG: hypothetical protein KJZ84_19610 [Bryobacteraceae bacterium]|nr:hypothetical protein [Bryobacteraceae bacterium]